MKHHESAAVPAQFYDGATTHELDQANFLDLNKGVCVARLVNAFVEKEGRMQLAESSKPMLSGKLLIITCFGAMTLLASAANAAPLLFSFAGPSGTASFQLDSNPVPDFVNSISFLPGSDQFGFTNVSGTFGGMSGVASTISFGEGIFASLNIVAPTLGFTQFSSPTLFTGPPESPVFTAGTFTLINPFFGNGTLVISPLTVAAVPEPATWAMMIFGLGLVGAAMRYRRRDSDNAVA